MWEGVGCGRGKERWLLAGVGAVDCGRVAHGQAATGHGRNAERAGQSAVSRIRSHHGLAKPACVTRRAREEQCPLAADEAADCGRAARGQAAARHWRIPCNSHSRSPCHSRARVPDCPPVFQSQAGCAQCPPNFLRWRTHAFASRACLLPPARIVTWERNAPRSLTRLAVWERNSPAYSRTSPSEQGTFVRFPRAQRRLSRNAPCFPRVHRCLGKERSPLTHAPAAFPKTAPPSPPGQKNSGGVPSPPPPRAVTPWCRTSCGRPVCVCASDARSGRHRRRSCSLCGSQSCPGPRCGRCRRIRA